MNKNKLLLATTTFIASTTTHAAFLAPGSTGTIDFTAGCFNFSLDGCEPGGFGSISDNGDTVRGFGSGIAGDGLVGRIGFTVGADGNTLSITSYQQDTYDNTAGGLMGFALEANGGLGGFSGYISDSGDVSLVLDRISNWGAFSYLDGTAWNVDDSPTISGQGDPVTGVLDGFTSGADFAWTPFTPGSMTTVVNGSALASAGTDSWTGRIVSIGNIGSSKDVFEGTVYAEVFDVTVHGVSAVPLPASAWLFASGLLGLVQAARSRRTPGQEDE